jgi:hypothetical protein
MVIFFTPIIFGYFLVENPVEKTMNCSSVFATIFYHSFVHHHQVHPPAHCCVILLIHSLVQAIM